MDGPDIFHGRAEVYISEVKDWATFCAEDWNYKLAKVVWRELNYRPATWTGKSRYGEGIGPISNCPTYEDWLFFPESCSVLYISPPTTTCDHSMDIGVHCDGLEQGRCVCECVYPLKLGTFLNKRNPEVWQSEDVVTGLFYCKCTVLCVFLSEIRAHKNQRYTFL